MIGISQKNLHYYPLTQELVVRVGVEDVTIRAQKSDFNGLETPFAVMENAAGEWQRFEARGEPNKSVRGEPTTELYEIHIPNVSRKDLERIVNGEGVAVGIESNVGVLWGQERGHNNHTVEAFFPGEF